jgi:hypothetical protein
MSAWIMGSRATILLHQAGGRAICHRRVDYVL